MEIKTAVITGGAGFIGVNAAEAFIRDGWHVILFDNLSRKGTDLNLRYLQQRFPAECEFVLGDVRYDYFPLLHAVGRAELVLHLAAQVAVTTSIVRPTEDFEINARGTFNVLEAIRESGNKPLVIYSSTNKVYGGMTDVAYVKGATRYGFRDFPEGIAEDRPLDFHSPYGCSKGAADQYVHDYGRIYGIPIGGIPPVVHLRPEAVWGGGPGMGGLVLDRGAAGKTDHDLRRWPAIARPAAR